jgi:hypothetical protein
MSNRGPELAGRPSPSLRKMQRMTVAQLREHLARLEQERGSIAARLQARQRAGATSGHDGEAVKQEQRLAALIAEGRDLLARPAWERYGSSAAVR